jgi:hypothetical protein
MKTEKMSFKNIKDVLSRDEMKMVMAGSGSVTREEYCATNTMIMQSCYNRGDNACIAAAGAAWTTECKPYGL